MIFKSRQEVYRRCVKHKKDGKKIVMVTGVFDLLHQEHINFLYKAKQAGDILIVGLETDNRVKAIKGEGRPVNHQIQRLRNLNDLKIADYLFLLPVKFNQSQHHDNLIGHIQPDILAVSSHTSHLKEKRAIIEKHHGQLGVVYQHNPNLSTTIIIKKREKKHE